MPCTKCKADFTVFVWKIKCYECEANYCSKCLKKIDGDVFCETCSILIKRPPVRTKLMELKSKDLQTYLNKHNVSTHGIVEKQELVELFCKGPIPPKDKKCGRRFNNFTGSVPNLAHRWYVNNLRTPAEAAFNSRNWNGAAPAPHSAHSTPTRTSPTQPTAASPGYPTVGDSVPPHVFTAPTTSASNADSGSASASNMTNSPTYTIPMGATFTPPPTAPITEEAEASPQVTKKFLKLSDFESLDDLNDLSVKQLKELLSLNRVDYKGCVEKGELLERVNRLWIDSNIRKEEVAGDSAGNLDEACKICMDAPLDCVLLECGHMATCIECGKRLAECPICRQYVTRVVRTFKA